MFLPESPKFLLCKGKSSEALQVDRSRLQKRSYKQERSPQECQTFKWKTGLADFMSTNHHHLKKHTQQHTQFAP